MENQGNLFFAILLECQMCVWMLCLGSEHTLAGLHYPAELHIVHEGLTNPNQLAVIGVFFVLGDDDKALYQECTVLNKIIDPGLLFIGFWKIDEHGFLRLWEILHNKMRCELELRAWAI